MRHSVVVLVLSALFICPPWARGQDLAVQAAALGAETEAAIAALRPTVAAVPNLPETRRAVQSLDQARRIPALASDLQAGRIDVHRFGDELDAMFEQAIVTTWDMHLARARQALAAIQLRTDAQTGPLGVEWIKTMAGISRREGLSAAERQRLIDAAAAPVEPREREILDAAGRELDAVAAQLATGRQQLLGLISARTATARAAKRVGAPDRLSAIVEEHLESVGPGGPAPSSFDLLMASAELRVPTIVLRAGRPPLGLAPRIQRLLALDVSSDIPPNQLMPEREPQPRILGVTVLRSPADQDVLFLDEAPPPGYRQWTLFVLGRDLLQTKDGARAPGIDFVGTKLIVDPNSREPIEFVPRVSGDRRISYSVKMTIHGLQNTRDDLMLEGFSKTLFDFDPDDELANPHDGLLVVATVPENVLPGFRRLQIGPARAEWLVHPGTMAGSLRALRVVSAPRNEFDYLHDTFMPDRIQFELTVQQPTGATTARIALFRNDEAITFGEQKELALLASLVPGSDRVYRTPPIFIHEQSRAHPDARTGDVAIGVRAGDSIAAVGADPWFQVPPVDRVAVHTTPGSLTFDDGASVLWKDATREAAGLWGRRIDNWETLTVNEVDSITNVVVFNLDWHTTRFTIADHAAMLLLRRQMLVMARQQKEDFQKILTDDALLWGYYLELMPVMDRLVGRPGTFFLANVQVRAPGSRPTDLSAERSTVPFVRAFDLLYLRREFGGLPAAKYFWQRDVVREVVTKQIQWLDQAMARARNIEAKDLEGLVNLTGDSFEQVIDRLRPQMLRLVDIKNAKGVPVAARWQPDETARAALTRVRTVMAELGTARKAAREDTDALLAFATAATLNPTAMLSKIILAAASIGSVATAVSDIAKLDTNRAEYAFARGVAPIVGYDRFNLAQAASRTPSWVPYATFLASFIGLHMDIGDLALGMRLSLAYRSAERIVGSIKQAGIRGLRKVSDNEARAFLIALEDSRLARETGQALTPVQKNLLDSADRLESEIASLVNVEPEGAPAHWFAGTEILGPEQLAAAQREASRLMTGLQDSGAAGLARLTPDQKDALAAAVGDAQAARAASRSLTAEQKQLLQSSEALEKKLAADGLDVTEIVPFRPTQDGMGSLGKTEDLAKTDTLGKTEDLAKTGGLSRTAIGPPPNVVRINVKEPPPGLPRPGTPFHLAGMPTPIRLGKYRGGGVFSAVYDSADEVGKVVKIVRLPSIEIGTLDDALRRMDRSAKLLAEHSDDIPQLATRSIKQYGDYGIVVQDALPEGYKLAEEISRQAAYEAGLELYVKMRSKGIAWLDGHIGNMYFIPQAKGGYRAGILDPDMCMRTTDAVGDIAMARRIAGFEELGGISELHRAKTIFSLENNPQALRPGFELWDKPDAQRLMKWNIDELTVHMLERWGFIKFVRTPLGDLRAGATTRGYWSDGVLSIDRVREALKQDLDRFVTYGNSAMKRPPGQARRWQRDEFCCRKAA